MPKKVVIGVVTSDSMTQTRRVEVERRVQHPKYKKYIRRRTVCHVHDPEEACHVGDTVEIEECLPISKTKHWQLLRIVRKSELVDVAKLRAEARAQARQEALDAKQSKDQEVASKKAAKRGGEG